MELVEGRKDAPAHLPPKEYANLGKTVSLMLRLTQPLHHTSKVVVMDSGFCVLKGLAELRRRGVFAQALIKKRRYWPKYVDGEAIKNHFEGRKVGDADAWGGTLEEQKFYIFASGNTGKSMGRVC